MDAGSGYEFDNYGGNTDLTEVERHKNITTGLEVDVMFMSFCSYYALLKVVRTLFTYHRLDVSSFILRVRYLVLSRDSSWGTPPPV